MKRFPPFFLAAFIIITCGYHCGMDRDRWEEVLFEFEIPLSIAPGTDTITVGEELILTANFPDSLFDFYSQKKYHLPNFNLKTVAVIRKLINPNLNITEQQSAVSKFQITNSIGELSNFSSTFVDVNFIYNVSYYKLIAKLKPKESGIYSIKFYHDPGTRGSTELPQELAPNGPGVKRFPLMRHTRYIFNNGTTHFNIYKQHCSPADPNEATNWVESKSTYTFVVK